MTPREEFEADLLRLLCEHKSYIIKKIHGIDLDDAYDEFKSFRDKFTEKYSPVEKNDK